MEERKFVNGPENIIKLVGEIDNIKKTIIVLMYNDFVPKRGEIICKWQNSINMDSYLVDELSKIENMTFDIFTNSTTKIQSRDVNDVYINNINASLARMAIKTENIRFHTSDFFSAFSKLIGKNNNMYETIVSIANEYMYLQNEKSLIYEIIETFNQMINELNKMIAILDGQKMNNDEKKILYDIFHKCRNNKIKEHMNELKNKVIDKLNAHIKHIVSCKDVITKLSNHSLYSDNVLKCDVTQKCYYASKSDFIRNYLQILKTEITSLYFSIISSMMCINAIFFIRRIMDKKYINNAVFICYIPEAIRFIQACCNTFGFKVDFASYVRSSIDDLNKKIKEAEHLELLDIFRYENNFEFDLLQPTITQCSEVTHLKVF